MINRIAKRNSTARYTFLIFLLLAITIIVVQAGSAAPGEGKLERLHESNPADGISKTGTTTWAENFSDMQSMSKAADLIVIGTVTSVERGRVVVLSDGVHKPPFYNVTITVQKVLRSNGLRNPDIAQ